MNKSENRTKKYFFALFIFVHICSFAYCFFTDIHKRLKHNQ